MEKKLLKINNKVVLKIDINGGNFYQWKYRNAVWWNQIIPNSSSEEIYKESIIGQGLNVRTYDLNCIAGHIYICHVQNKTSVNFPTNYILQALVYDSINRVSLATHRFVKRGEYETAYLTFKATVNGRHSFQQCRNEYPSAEQENNPITLYTKNAFIIDLTAMFGEGKEPTAEEFRKMYPCDYYPYCAGEWRYASGGQYVNFNQLANHNIKGNRNGVSFNFINNKIILNGTCNKTDNIYVWKMADKTSNKHKYLSICYGADSTKAWISKNSGFNNVNTIGSFAFNYCVRCIEGAIFNDFELSTLLIDLTQMFGEGNEPTTVEEFKALYPDEYYEYVESRYEYTPGYYENGLVVKHIPDTAHIIPITDTLSDTDALTMNEHDDDIQSN